MTLCFGLADPKVPKIATVDDWQQNQIVRGNLKLRLWMVADEELYID
jgi:hypothetical protein